MFGMPSSTALSRAGSAVAGGGTLEAAPPRCGMPRAATEAVPRRCRLRGRCAESPVPEVSDGDTSTSAEGSEEAEACAICFEVHPTVPLPCSCRVAYCAACWDRSLANSVLQCGVAQCPTCRCSFRVDFDEDRGLVLHPAMEGTSKHEWRTQLYNKARPAQIGLLKSYGATPAPKEAQPQCVCGAPLERIADRDRIVRMLEDTDAEWRSKLSEDSEVLVNRLLSRTLVTCDLCEEDATRSGFVWTCRNGPYMVLHPAAYDICERCFAEHSGQPLACGVSCARRDHPAAHQQWSRGGGHAEAVDDNGPPRCWYPCAAALRSLLPRRFCGAGAAPRAGPPAAVGRRRLDGVQGAEQLSV